MRLPKWLKKPLSGGFGSNKTAADLHKRGLCTVCEEARCPNLPECYKQRRATFLLLGSECTRKCSFCSVNHSRHPLPPDEDELYKVADYCREHRLRHVVLTMVTRDDLPDGGAAHVVKVMQTVRELVPEAACELLTSDFDGNWEATQCLLEHKPEVFAHNIETVRFLSSRIRSVATYDRSLQLLRRVKEKYPQQVTKSSLMVGLGETRDQIVEALFDLAQAGIDMVTIGQYLQPTPQQIAVKEWIEPELFEEYAETARELGIRDVMSGPFVRSSYAAHTLQKA